ncbi:MAG: helix-turn-helix domain-containing protein, partial [archaeon]|nr:helix-turn-helix domain-containing protein [archaeon]
MAIHYYKLELDRNEMLDMHTCRSMVPIDPSKIISTDIIKCSSMNEEGRGFSIMRINTNGDVDLRDSKYEMDGGDCQIDKISSGNYLASITNNKCFLCRIISQSKCFLMSAVRQGEKIEWTVLGQDSSCVRDLVSTLREKGYTVNLLAGGKFNEEMTLTPKEEKYLRIAFDQGYYDVPRRTDLDALCERIGCSKSTLNVSLRNAERKII